MHDYLSLHKIVSRSEGRLRRIESMTRTDWERKDGKGFSSGFLVLRRDQDADRYKIQDLTPIGHCGEMTTQRVARDIEGRASWQSGWISFEFSIVALHAHELRKRKAVTPDLSTRARPAIMLIVTTVCPKSILHTAKDSV